MIFLNKHQMLMPLFVESPGVVGIDSLDGLGRDSMPVGAWDPDKSELTMILTRPGAKPHYRLNFRFQIALRENTAELCGPAIPLLFMMGQEVEGAINEIERATLQTGLL